MAKSNNGSSKRNENQWHRKKAAKEKIIGNAGEKKRQRKWQSAAKGGENGVARSGCSISNAAK